MTNKWLEEIHKMPKLRSYVLFKTNFAQENYLSLIQGRVKRSLLALLRLGTLPLEIEVGRYRGIPLEERLCQICKTGDIESECHFIADRV